jgi:hypothetical protein
MCCLFTDAPYIDIEHSVTASLLQFNKFKFHILSPSVVIWVAAESSNILLSLSSFCFSSEKAALKIRQQQQQERFNKDRNRCRCLSLMMHNKTGDRRLLMYNMTLVTKQNALST